MENIILEKSFAFAVRIVNASRYLNDSKREFVLSKQLIRSGTSVGANIEEAMGAQSDADFVSKLSIARKEARETHYWIRLLEATNFFSESESRSLLNDVDEILKILTSIILTAKSKLEKNS
ncbi:MAG: four helix bundle protein [Planctomycetaceae bacterium]|nr:four helix bundle protein [Planctomycetaceae bacterium]